MSKYGIPYQGNKSKIAEDIIFALPSGKRLVDLFGGGGAITHCAALSGKWKEIYYNDINSLMPDFLYKAIHGYYNYERFKPEFITREKFFELKDKDGYVRCIWSFGNNGDSYLFGVDIEKQKKAIHNAIVFEDYKQAQALGIDTSCLENVKGGKNRRYAWRKYISQQEGIERKNGHLYLNGVNVEQLSEQYKPSCHIDIYIFPTMWHYRLLNP